MRFSGLQDSLLILLIVTGILLAFSLQGLDLTDLGWHLTNQMCTVKYSPNFDSFDWTFLLSNYAGGIWLSLIGGPSVLWARIGGALLVGVNSVIVYSILSRHFGRMEVLLTVPVTALFIAACSSQILIHYFSFPAFLLCVEFWLLDRAMDERSGTNKLLIGMGMGGLLIPIILSYLPMGLLLVFPLIAITYIRLTDAYLELRRVFVGALLGLSISLVLTLVVFLSAGILEGFWDAGISLISGGRAVADHEAADLIRLYAADLRRVILRTFLLGSFLLVVYRARKHGGKALQVAVGIALAGFIGGVLWAWTEGLIAIDPGKELSRVAMGWIFVATWIVLFRGDGRKPRLDILVLAGVLAMIVTPVGSNGGLVKAVYGMWLILPLSLLRVKDLPPPSCPGPLRWLQKNFKPIVIVLLALSLLTLWFTVYRDHWNRLDLTTGFSEPSLAGIYSTPERVEAVEGVLSFLDKETQKGDRTLFVNVVPLIYYLTETRPALNNSWLFLEELERIKTRQRKVNKLPTIFGYTSSFPDDEWPDEKKEGDSGNISEKIEFLEIVYVNELGYELAFESDSFVMYSRPGEDANVNHRET